MRFFFVVPAHFSNQHFARTGMLVIGCQSFLFILAFITIFSFFPPSECDSTVRRVHSARPIRNEPNHCGTQKCTAHEIHAARTSLRRIRPARPERKQTENQIFARAQPASDTQPRHRVLVMMAVLSGAESNNKSTILWGLISAPAFRRGFSCFTVERRTL